MLKGELLEEMIIGFEGGDVALTSLKDVLVLKTNVVDEEASVVHDGGEVVASCDCGERVAL